MREAWRYSQVVRQGSAKPLCPGSNPGGASSETGCKFSYSPLFLSKSAYLRYGFIIPDEWNPYETINFARAARKSLKKT